MILFRAENPEVLDYLEDKLIEERDYPRDVYVRHLKNFLLYNPKECLVLTLWEETEIKSFLIAFVPTERKHVFILQVWFSPELALTKWPKEMFAELKAFTKGLGLSEIRGATQRSPDAIIRKWGFEFYSTIMSFDLNKEN